MHQLVAAPIGCSRDSPSGDFNPLQSSALQGQCQLRSATVPQPAKIRGSVSAAAVIDPSKRYGGIQPEAVFGQGHLNGGSWPTAPLPGNSGLLSFGQQCKTTEVRLLANPLARTLSHAKSVATGSFPMGQHAMHRISQQALSEHRFTKRSMEPQVAAASSFVLTTGRPALIDIVRPHAKPRRPTSGAPRALCTLLRNQRCRIGMVSIKANTDASAR